MNRIDIVEDAAMSEAAARHEALHLGLFEVDPMRFEATKYHGGDWEQILSKVESGPVSLVGGREPAKYARIRGTVDGEQQDFGVIVVK
jgi:hypothetical protein